MFLCLDHGNIIAVYGRVRARSDFIQNILICVLEIVFGTIWGWVINDRVFILCALSFKKFWVCFTLSVESQHGLDGDVDAVEVVGLEHDLGDLLPGSSAGSRAAPSAAPTVGRVDCWAAAGPKVWSQQVQHVLPSSGHIPFSMGYETSSMERHSLASSPTIRSCREVNSADFRIDRVKYDV